MGATRIIGTRKPATNGTGWDERQTFHFAGRKPMPALQPNGTRNARNKNATWILMSNSRATSFRNIGTHPSPQPGPLLTSIVTPVAAPLPSAFLLFLAPSSLLLEAHPPEPREINGHTNRKSGHAINENIGKPNRHNAAK